MGRGIYQRRVRGFFAFDDKGGGEFQFGYVHGWMDCRLTTRDGEPAVEWTWEGNDEMDPAQGRGWAVLEGDELVFYAGLSQDEVARQLGVSVPTVKRRWRSARLLLHEATKTTPPEE